MVGFHNKQTSLSGPPLVAFLAYSVLRLIISKPCPAAARSHYILSWLRFVAAAVLSSGLESIGEVDSQVLEDSQDMRGARSNRGYQCCDVSHSKLAQKLQQCMWIACHPGFFGQGLDQ
jgi:hypothetical protein